MHGPHHDAQNNQKDHLAAVAAQRERSAAQVFPLNLRRDFARLKVPKIKEF